MLPFMLPFMISLRYYTDPACPWSWALEPCIRKLMVQFGDQLALTFVMGGLARDFSDGLTHGVWGRDTGPAKPPWSPEPRGELVEQWLRVAEETGAPLDPLLWVEGGLKSSYPACMAVEAARDQASDGGRRYLRRLREAILCERRQLDHVEALVGEGRAAGLDVERLRIDLRSHAITEAFGADLEEAKALGAEVGASGAESSEGRGERGGIGPCSRGVGAVPLPSVVLRREDGNRGEGDVEGDGEDDEKGRGLERRVLGFHPYEAYTEALTALGVRPSETPAPRVAEVLTRFGRVTTREVELIAELPGPRAGAELYRLAEQWKVRLLRTPTGPLWQAETT